MGCMWMCMLFALDSLNITTLDTNIGAGSKTDDNDDAPVTYDKTLKRRQSVGKKGREDWDE